MVEISTAIASLRMVRQHVQLEGSAKLFASEGEAGRVSPDVLGVLRPGFQGHPQRTEKLLKELTSYDRDIRRNDRPVLQRSAEAFEGHVDCSAPANVNGYIFVRTRVAPYVSGKGENRVVANCQHGRRIGVRTQCTGHVVVASCRYDKRIGGVSQYSGDGVDVHQERRSKGWIEQV